MDDNSYLYENGKRLHGVPHLSRYNHFEEWVEMESFLHKVASAGLADLLTGLFYDSKACLCFIETVDDIEPAVAEMLYQAASSSISQFELFGRIGHSG